MNRRKRMLENLDADIRDHIERETQDNIDRGMSPDKARRAAFLKFGNARRVKEDAHRIWTITWLEQLLQDVNYAVRMLRKTPVITAIALLSLALGIGANTAIFSLIDAVMLRMLPVQNPEQLAEIQFRSPFSPMLRQTVTNPIWEQVRDHQDAFAGVFAWGTKKFDLADGGEEKNIQGVYASGSYFDVLGVRPAAGRLLSPSDDVRGCSGAAVLSYGYWQSRYGGADSAIGSLIRLSGHAFPIVGVAQRGFSGADVGAPLDVVVPICAEAILDGKDSSLDVRDDWWLQMMGRLKPGISFEQADARMKVLSQPLFGAVVPQEWPSKYQDAFRKYTFAVFPGTTGTGGAWRSRYSQPLEILMFVVGLVLLIACANIASLLLARSAARQKEIAVRLSLGASRVRLIRQVLTESLVLSGAGAILGVLFARWGSALLVRFVSTPQSPVFLDLKMDSRVLAFTIGIAVFCGFLFGILPALRSTRVSPMSALKEGQLQGHRDRSQSTALRWIVASQVALSLILVIGAGLFIRTFTNLMILDAGFDPNNVLMIETNIHNARIPEAARVPLYGRMLAQLRVLPGVLSASQCWMTPLSGMEWDNSLAIPNGSIPAGADSDILMNWITPDFFSTMRIPVLAGRSFDTRDSATSAPVVIVNQLLARTYFPGQNAIGKHLMSHDRGMLGTRTMEIVGVTQNAKYLSLREDFQPEAYFPLTQIGAVGEGTTFELRTAMNPSTIIPAVRDAMAAVNKSASLRFVTLKQEAGDSVLQEHLLAVLSGFFGALALLLTAIGLYGVMAYVVTLRTHEIGIRMALGAPQSSVLGLVVRGAAFVMSIGTVAGVLGALGVTRLVRQLLFGVKPIDPWSLSLAVLALLCVAAIATYVPVRRAMRVDPASALRCE
ncbi:MAG TPA: ABC transporter permease [Candidatus Acidoferrales bacterium]|nr:ABC transporter permease [Candidatus Acidoferrales bacterium]